MFYLIIPPVVIVVSLALILYLFSKKGAELAERKEILGKNNLTADGVVNQKGRSALLAKLSNFWLKFLEKFIQRTKVLFLKFHNFSDKLVKSLKEKRKKNGEAKKEVEAVVEKKAEVSAGTLEKIIRRPEVISARKIKVAEFGKEERPVAPIISEKVTQPEPRFFRTEMPSEVTAPRAEEKKEYEQLLIERIAGNPKDIEAYERLGNYYFEQKSFQDAKECFKQVLRLSPINRQARAKMRKLERILGA